MLLLYLPTQLAVPDFYKWNKETHFFAELIHELKVPSKWVKQKSNNEKIKNEEKKLRKI